LLFTAFEFNSNIMHIAWPIPTFWTYVTDSASVIGLGLRTTAAAIATGLIAFYFTGKIDNAKALKLLKIALALEAARFFITYFPSAIWAVADARVVGRSVGILMQWTIPCWVESLLIPAVLIVLIWKLKPSNSINTVLKWALISGVAYCLVLWLNYFGSWVLALLGNDGYYPFRGIPYLTSYPINMVNFLIGTVGLIVIALYTAYLATKVNSIKNMQSLSRKVGAITTGLGLCYFAPFLIYIVFGNVQVWNAWTSWFLGHNPDLWMMMLPLLGLPLLFYGVKPENT
jgi:hypothetical protein